MLYKINMVSVSMIFFGRFTFYLVLFAILCGRV